MKMAAYFLVLVLALVASPALAGDGVGAVRLAQGIAPAAATTTAGLFDQDWRLNPAKSYLSMTTVKQPSISEAHSFTALDGTVSAAGDAQVNIDLSSLATNIDIRDVRMRFLFFETFKFPNAIVTAHLDKAALQDLLVSKPVALPLTLTLDLHGVKKAMTVDVTVTRTGPNAVSVASVAPVEVQAVDFALTGGIARLSQVAGGIDIVPTAWLAFELAFEGTNNNPQLDAVRTAAANRRTQETTRSLTADECQNRMDVISKTRQIYFRTASAEIDAKESAPVLNEVAQFTNRCTEVAIEISGHTDMDGTKEFNQKLSEQRAQAVADALVQRGVLAKRIKTVGYGFGRPVAENNTDAGKQQNRRIEFSRVGASAEAK